MDAMTNNPGALADPVEFYGTKVNSRLLLGTAQYPSPAILSEAIRASGAEIVTVSLRRESGVAKSGQSFWQLIRDLGVKVLPNTAGCKTVKEAVTTAEMARELFGTPWVKLEVIGEDDTLQPDVFGLVEAARILSRDGFEVFPYTTEDLVVAEKLIGAGCEVLMPWGRRSAPAAGSTTPMACARCGRISPACRWWWTPASACPRMRRRRWRWAMMPVLLNTAVAKAGDPVRMARAFARAIEAGREAVLADPMEVRDMAAPSTPVMGRAVLGQ